METTVHVARFGLTDVAVDVVSLRPPQPLAEWWRARGGGDSTALIAGGRLQNTPRADDGTPLDGARPAPSAILFRER